MSERGAPAAPGLKTSRRTGGRRKSSGSASERPSAKWSDLTEACFDAVSSEASIDRVNKSFKVFRGEGSSETPVKYTQEIHNANFSMFVEFEMFVQALKFIIRDLHEQVQTLSAAIETKHALEYRGVFRADTDYQPGNVITHNGSMWHANQKTSATPGDGSSDWTLCVKRGAPGKDATKEVR